MINLRVAFCLMVMFLTGCGTVPSKVALPKDLGETTVDTNGRPTTNNTAAQKRYDGYAKDMGIQPVATTRKSLLYQLNLLIGEWNSQASLLLLERDTVDNVNFLGIVTGAGLVVADQLKAAKGVAAVVAGVNLASENYKIVIQASNYVTAAEAVECIRTQVVEVSDDAWAKFFDDSGNVRSSLNMDLEQRAALQATFPQINSAMSSIYKKLRSNQRAVRITAPTADSISKAISDTQKQVGVVENLGAKSFSGTGTQKTFLVTPVVNSEYELALLKQLLAVSGKAQTCATALGS